MPMPRRTLLAGSLLFPLGVQAAGGESREDLRARLLKEDWPALARYAADNAAFLKSGAKADIVFMGDSITEAWKAKRPGFFTAGRVCRGISGQTTPQMVLRMMADVIALRPRLVHFMAGTNDVAGNTGTMTVRQTCDNLRMMAELARASHIDVLLASVPPANGFPWRPEVAPVAPIRAINAWAKDYAGRTHAIWVDYTPALADAEGAMRPGMADDGVHPTEAGYTAMESVLAPVLKAKRA